MLNRNQSINEINKTEEWDIVVIGGGATGLGVALDAVSRGYSTLLVEKVDFGKGTSSRSTKLVHGGVRYLQQGNISLVTEALKERSYLLEVADHVSRVQPFIIPFYSRLMGLYYYAGLKAYDLLAGGQQIGNTTWLSKDEVIQRVGNINSSGLKGGILYYDGQFDDARLCIDLVKTIVTHGGTCINYCSVEKLTKDSIGNCTGVIVHDVVNDNKMEVKAKAVVNATGVFTNAIIKMDDPGQRDLVKPSRGSHIVLDKQFLGGDVAVMIPKTSDGRVLFLIPWNSKVLVGTTDIATDHVEYEPRVQGEEINFMLNNATQYLNNPPSRSDIRSTYSGLRPLAAPKDESAKTKEISRGHQILWSRSGMCNIIGGKWTTFRKMGEDVLDAITKEKEWNPRSSTSIKIIIDNEIQSIDYEAPLSLELIKKMIKEEMVVNLEDLVARRTRLLFLDIDKVKSVLEEWAELLRIFYKKDKKWKKDQIEQVSMLIEQVYAPDAH